MTSDPGRPPAFASLPPAAWPVEAASYVLAVTANDWVTIISGVILALGSSAALLGKFLWGKYEASNLRTLLAERADHRDEVAKVRRELAECRADLDQAVAELKDERSDRVGAKERNRLEAEKRAAENDELRDLVSTLRAQLAEAYKTIADRDHTVTENSRRIGRADATLTVLSAMVLELLGDARARKP